MKYKIGDEVEGRSNIGCEVRGKIQEIEGLFDPYRVNGQWCDEKDLKLIKKKPTIKKDYVYILMSFGQTEDRVIKVSKNEKKLKSMRQWLEANFLDYSFGLIKKELK